MPYPWSDICRMILVSVSWTDRCMTVPLGEYLKAFVIRLKRMLSNLSGSAHKNRGDSLDSKVISLSRWMAIDWKLFIICSMNGAISILCTVSLDSFCIFCKSSTWLMIFSVCLVFRFTRARSCWMTGLKSFCESMWSMGATISVKGVRSSWIISVKNLVFISKICFSIATRFLSL